MQIKVASPCKREWSKMSGDERVRFCSDCKMNVYNLSAMSQAELTELVKQREGRVCVRFFSRPDGTVVTRDCPVGVSRKRRTYAVSMAAMVALLAAPFATAQEECTLNGEPTLVESVRSFFFELKVKLGLTPAPMTHTVGMMVMPPPPAGPTTPPP